MADKLDKATAEGTDATETDGGKPTDPSKNPESENAPGGQSDTSKAKAEAKEKRQAKKAEPEVNALAAPGGDTRRRMNRGSTRRLNRAHTNFQEALKAFREEVDRQVYETAEKPDDWPEGKPYEPERIGECELVKGLDKTAEGVREMINSYMG